MIAILRGKRSVCLAGLLVGLLLSGMCASQGGTGATRSVRITMTSNVNSTAQLFFDRGAGFTEQDSRFARVQRSETPQVMTFELPPGPIKRLRFDPTCDEGRVEIASVRVVGDGGHPTTTVDLSTLVPEEGVTFAHLPSGVLRVDVNSLDSQLAIPLSGDVGVDDRRLAAHYGLFAFGLLVSAFFLLMLVRSSALARVWSVCRRLGLVDRKEALRRGRQRALVAITLVAGGFLGSWFLQRSAESSLNLVLDAEIGAGRRIEAYVNKDGAHPIALPVRETSRQLYVFRDLPSRITHLRLDPTDVAGAQIIVHGLTLSRGGRVVGDISLREVARWNLWGADWVTDTADGRLKILSKTADPQLEHDVNLTVAAKWLPGWLRPIALATPAASVMWVLALATVIGILKSHRFAASLGCALALAGSYFLAWQVSAILEAQGGDIPSVSQAVGAASYLGYSKSADFRAFWGALASVIACASIAAVLARTWHTRETNTSQEQGAVATGARFSLGFVVSMVLFGAWITFPYLEYLQAGAAGSAHAGDYDSQNHVTWQYCSHLGLTPLRDFWYPYSGFYYLYSRFPPGALLFWLHQVLVFGVCVASVYRLFDYSKGRLLTVIALMAGLLSTDLVQSTPRYFLSLSFVLFTAACIESRKRLVAVCWGAYAFYVFFLEPNQAVYATPGCLAILMGTLFTTGTRERRFVVVRNLGIALAVAGTLLVLHVGNLARIGALEGTLRFYLSMDAMAVYGAVPAPPSQWFFGSGPETLLLVFTLGLAGASAWRVVTRAPRLALGEDLVPLAVSLVAILAFQKQMIRPHIANHLIALPVAGLLLLAFGGRCREMRGGLATRMIVSVAAGFLFFVAVLANGTAARAWQSYGARAIQVPRDIRAAVVGPTPWSDVERTYFSPEAFTVDGVNGRTLRAMIMERTRLGEGDRVFVLGDDSYLNAVLSQAPTFYFTFYNQSPLDAQKDSAAWIAVHRPKFVLWRKTFSSFDQVPNQVRVPLLYERVIRDYVYDSTAGPFTILRRRAPGEEVSFDFWRDALGATTDLGFVPGRSDPAALDGPGPYAAQTFTYLVCDVSHPMHGRSREVSFNVRGKEYFVRFRERQGVSSYRVLLDRVWFWQLAHQSGIQTAPVSGQPDISLRLATITSTRDTLY